MLKETERIEDQLKRAFHGEAWHGPSVKEAVAGVSPEAAAQRPVKEAHSIWELVHHITAWVDIVRRRVQGEVFDVTDDMNFPPVTDTAQTAWQESLRRMEAAETELRRIILGLPESRLDQPALEGSPTVYILLHGAIQHSLYHAGQIVLLKKAVDKG